MTKPEKLHEIIEGATAGPWVTDGGSYVRSKKGTVADCRYKNGGNDAPFIATARKELPLLLDLVDGIIPAIRGALSNPAIMATHNYEPLHKALLSYEVWVNEGTKPEMEG